MTKNEMLERSRKALAEFARLPPEEQFRQLIAIGWLAILGGLFVIVAAGTWLTPAGVDGS